MIRVHQKYCGRLFVSASLFDRVRTPHLGCGSAGHQIDQPINKSLIKSDKYPGSFQRPGVSFMFLFASKAGNQQGEGGM